MRITGIFQTAVLIYYNRQYSYVIIRSIQAGIALVNVKTAHLVKRFCDLQLSILCLNRFYNVCGCSYVPK